MPTVPGKIGSWKVGGELGSGAFSSVYEGEVNSASQPLLNAKVGKSTKKGSSTPFNGPWVLKIANFPLYQGSNPKKKSKKQKEQEAPGRLIFWEYQIYQNFLKDIGCIPRRPPQRLIYGESVDKQENVGWRFLALEKLSCTLRQKIGSKGSSFPSHTIANIAIQLIFGMKEIHEKAILFRDVKPENFMLGTGDLDWKVHFVDFGASSKYILHSGKHLDTGSGPVGTALYMSVFAHENEPPSRRDDLISLAYMLVYMSSTSRLPWEKCAEEGDVVKMKRKSSSKDLVGNVSNQELKAALIDLLEETMSLGVTDTPNYELYISSFAKLLPGTIPSKFSSRSELEKVARSIGLTWSSSKVDSLKKQTKATGSKGNSGTPSEIKTAKQPSRKKQVTKNKTTKKPMKSTSTTKEDKETVNLVSPEQARVSKRKATTRSKSPIPKAVPEVGVRRSKRLKTKSEEKIVK